MSGCWQSRSVNYLDLCAAANGLVATTFLSLPSLFRNGTGACSSRFFVWLRPAVILIVMGLGVWAVEVYNLWFASNFQYGVPKTPPYLYRGSIVGAAALQEPLPDGRIVMATYRGHLPDKNLLPSP